MANIVPFAFGGELLTGNHNFANGGNSFKIALYTSNPYSTSSTVYVTTNQVSASGTNYSAGGKALASQAVVASSAVATVDFANVVWTSATFGAAYAAIYNTSTTPANKLVVILDFGGTKTATNGDFTIAFPDPTSGSPAGVGAILSLNSN
mgnify:FL=1|jgi:hypothetical protein|tara:strand:- start:547 stop:996 length:450 start_codon:yes stop_codon:yes gene_type:complete